jgi:hypothetical protein
MLTTCSSSVCDVARGGGPACSRKPLTATLLPACLVPLLADEPQPALSTHVRLRTSIIPCSQRGRTSAGLFAVPSQIWLDSFCNAAGLSASLPLR